jgi:hypothetical protein
VAQVFLDGAGDESGAHGKAEVGPAKAHPHRQPQLRDDEADSAQLDKGEDGRMNTIFISVITNISTHS